MHPHGARHGDRLLHHKTARPESAAPVPATGRCLTRQWRMHCCAAPPYLETLNPRLDATSHDVLQCTRREAERRSESFMAAIPGIRRWRDALLAEGRRTSWVSTLGGRRRYFPNLNSADSGAPHFGLCQRTSPCCSLAQSCPSGWHVQVTVHLSRLPWLLLCTSLDLTLSQARPGCAGRAADLCRTSGLPAQIKISCQSSSAFWLPQAPARRMSGPP